MLRGELVPMVCFHVRITVCVVCPMGVCLRVHVCVCVLTFALCVVCCSRPLIDVMLIVALVPTTDVFLLIPFIIRRFLNVSKLFPR